jgi:hypothetical protein
MRKVVLPERPARAAESLLCRAATSSSRRGALMTVKRGAKRAAFRMTERGASRNDASAREVERYLRGGPGIDSEGPP